MATVLFSSARRLSAVAPQLTEHSDPDVRRHELILDELGERPAARRGTLEWTLSGRWCRARPTGFRACAYSCSGHLRYAGWQRESFTICNDR